MHEWCSFVYEKVSVAGCGSSLRHQWLKGSVCVCVSMYVRWLCDALVRGFCASASFHTFNTALILAIDSGKLTRCTHTYTYILVYTFLFTHIYTIIFI